MASLIDRLRMRSKPATDEEAQPRGPRRRPLPPAGQLRRERRALLHLHEQRIRDLGGLVLEMYRQDRFRQDLVYEQAAEVVAIEERLHDIDLLLSAAGARGSAKTVRCVQCGVPLFAGARFCPSCGAEQTA
jgi:hypothetical protein